VRNVIIQLQGGEQKMSTETKVVVTGAAGFVGSNLSKRLEDKGYNLVLIDDFSRGKQKYLDWLGVETKCKNVDLKDPISKVYFEDADIVYHTASRIGGNQYLHGSKLNEISAYLENMAIDINVFKSCIEHNIKKIIYTSSVSVYNTTSQNKNTDAMFREEDLKTYQIEPEGGYGWAKYMGEWLLQNMSCRTGIVRIFKSYGPCDDYSDESGQVVCSLMRKAINYPKEKYVVWGDGSVTRCLVYIDDLIDGLLKVEKYLDKKSIVVNMGGNEPIPIVSLARKIANLSNKDIQIQNDMSKPVGVKSRIPILTYAKKELDWEPTTSLEKGLIKTWEWMKEDMNE